MACALVEQRGIVRGKWWCSRAQAIVQRFPVTNGLCPGLLGLVVLYSSSCALAPKFARKKRGALGGEMKESQRTRVANCCETRPQRRGEERKQRG
jgi:hypothetical protein